MCTLYQVVICKKDKIPLKTWNNQDLINVLLHGESNAIYNSLDYYT